jgi:CBS domain-containing protein
MNAEDESRSSCGGDAPVVVYAADAVVIMPGDATLSAVAKELSDDEIGLVVIGARDDAKGVISERDIVHAVANGVDLDATPAVDIAHSSIVWCDRTASVHEVAELMMEHYVRHVLLEEDGHLVGIVSARDLLGAYTMADA